MTTSHLHKAAVVLASLPKQQADELLGRLDPAEAEAVAAETAKLHEIADAEQEAAVREFVGTGAAGLNAYSSAPIRPFLFLYDLPGEILIDLLVNEHPRTIAMVLSFLPPRQAATVLAELPPDAQLSVVRRIASAVEPQREAVRDVERAMKRRLYESEGLASGNRGIARVVGMLNVLEPATERRLLAELSEADPKLVHEIRRAMFGVDVAAYDDGGVTGAAC